MQIDQKIGDDTWIGPYRLEGQAVLAPLTGVTDVVMRRIARRYGAGLVVSEMVASGEYVAGSEEARLRSEGAGIAPHVVQLAGRAPAQMAEAARLAEAAGADLIDINMGCPAKRVTGGLAGSALMRDLDLAERIVAAVVQAVSVPVTVKMRLGWSRDRLDAPELSRRAVAAGATAITVHGRTRDQFYNGSADWAAIAPVVAAVPVPVIANGDIGSEADARACLAASGAAAVMIGRAAVGQPWIVGAIGAALAGREPLLPLPAERAAIAVEHYEGLLGLYGVRVGLRHARKHLAAYADRAAGAGFGLAPEERARLVTTEDPAEATSLLQRLYHPQPWARAA